MRITLKFVFLALMVSGTALHLYYTSYAKSRVIPATTANLQTLARHIAERGNDWLLNEPDTCAGLAADSLLVIVCSAVASWAQREAIRRTWGSVASRRPDQIRLLFLLGLPPASPASEYRTIQGELQAESRKYADIVQYSYTDSYALLSLKSLSLLEWSSRFCPVARHVLKSDEDMFINLPLLQHELRHWNRNDVIIGTITKGAVPQRNLTYKYYVSQEQYVHSRYPNYANGPAYVVSGALVPKLLYAAQNVSFLGLEDVYVTGLLAREIGAKLVNSTKFSYTMQDLDPCLFISRVMCHNVTTDQLYGMWIKILRQKSCEGLDNPFAAL